MIVFLLDLGHANATEHNRTTEIKLFSHKRKVFENHRKSLIQQVYILSGQKFIKNVKNSQFWRVFEHLKFTVKQCYQTSQF